MFKKLIKGPTNDFKSLPVVVKWWVRCKLFSSCSFNNFSFRFFLHDFTKQLLVIDILNLKRNLEMKTGCKETNNAKSKAYSMMLKNTRGFLKMIILFI